MISHSDLVRICDDATLDPNARIKIDESEDKKALLLKSLVEGTYNLPYNIKVPATFQDCLGELAVLIPELNNIRGNKRTLSYMVLSELIDCEDSPFRAYNFMRKKLAKTRLLSYCKREDLPLLYILAAQINVGDVAEDIDITIGELRKGKYESKVGTYSKELLMAPRLVWSENYYQWLNMARPDIETPEPERSSDWFAQYMNPPESAPSTEPAPAAKRKPAPTGWVDGAMNLPTDDALAKMAEEYCKACGVSYNMCMAVINEMDCEPYHHLPVYLRKTKKIVNVEALTKYCKGLRELTGNCDLV